MPRAKSKNPCFEKMFARRAFMRDPLVRELPPATRCVYAMLAQSEFSTCVAGLVLAPMGALADECGVSQRSLLRHLTVIRDANLGQFCARYGVVFVPRELRMNANPGDERWWQGAKAVIRRCTKSTIFWYVVREYSAHMRAIGDNRDVPVHVPGPNPGAVPVPVYSSTSSTELKNYLSVGPGDGDADAPPGPPSAPDPDPQPAADLPDPAYSDATRQMPPRPPASAWPNLTFEADPDGDAVAVADAPSSSSPDPDGKNLPGEEEDRAVARAGQGDVEPVQPSPAIDLTEEECTEQLRHLASKAPFIVPTIRKLRGNRHPESVVLVHVTYRLQLQLQKSKDLKWAEE